MLPKSRLRIGITSTQGNEDTQMVAHQLTSTVAIRDEQGLIMTNEQEHDEHRLELEELSEETVRLRQTQMFTLK